MGTSASPLLLTLPAKQNTLVPLLFSVPNSAYLSPPFLIIQDTEARVSTLLMLVGFPHNPSLAGNGGRGLGIPRLPSIDAIRAVSSPHTKAPAPCLILISKSQSVSNMPFPRKPLSSHCSMANC